MKTSRPMLLALVSAATLAACGGNSGSGGGGDLWYYHWSCNGDPQCLALNPGATGQASGTVGPEAGGQIGCNSLITFGLKNWNIPPAWQACDTSPTAPPPSLVSLTVSPLNPTLGIGQTRQFTATAHYSDGTTADVTAQTAWGAGPNYIGSPIVATISATGLATGGALGSTSIFADYGGLRATTGLTVGPAVRQSIVVTPATPTIAKGQTQQFVATAIYSDGTSKDVSNQVAWWSGTPSVAIIGSLGVASGVGVGSSVITATWSQLSGSATITVGPAALAGLYVSPPGPTIARGYAKQFRAIGNFTDSTLQDLTAQVAWSSGATAVATIDAAGLAGAVAAGNSLIKATAGAITGSTTVTVTAATLVSISVAPPTPIVAPGSTVQFTATGGFSDGSAQPLGASVTWASQTPAAATITSTGLASAVAVGSSTVLASLGAVSGNTLMTVSATPPGAAWKFLTSSPAAACPACGSFDTTLRSVVWGGNQFVAVAHSGAILTSPDGLTWTTRVAGDLSGAPSPGQLLAVAHAPATGRYVAVGSGYTSYSSDGITWAQGGGYTGADYLAGVVWAGHQFVAVGYQPTVGPAPRIFTSPDGITWTPRPTPFAHLPRAIAWSGTWLVAVGDGMLISADGVNWATTGDAAFGWTGVAWSGSQFVVVGSAGNIRTSPDGLAWTDRAPLPSSLQGVVWSGTQFVALGGRPGAGSAVPSSPGYLATSPDGVTWTPSTIDATGTSNGVSYSVYGAAWNGTRLVAVGYGPDKYYVYTSP